MKAPHSFVLLVTAAIFGMSLADQASIRQLACPFDILPLAFILFLSVLLIAFSIFRKGSKLLRGLDFHLSPVGSKQTVVGKEQLEVDKDAEAIHDAEVAEVTPPKDEEAATLDTGMLDSISDAALKKPPLQSRAQKKKEKKLRQRERVAYPTQVEQQNVEDSDPCQVEEEKLEQDEPEVTLPCNVDEEKIDLEKAGEEILMEEVSWCADLGPQAPLPGTPLEQAPLSKPLLPKGRSASGSSRRYLPPPPACLPPLPPKEEEEECEMPLLSYNRALMLLHRDMSKRIALGPPGLEHPASVLAMQGQRGLHASAAKSAP